MEKVVTKVETRTNRYGRKVVEDPDRCPGCGMQYTAYRSTCFCVIEEDNRQPVPDLGDCCGLCGSYQDKCNCNNKYWNEEGGDY